MNYNACETGQIPRSPRGRAPVGWYQYMKLRETMDAIPGGCSRHGFRQLPAGSLAEAHVWEAVTYEWFQRLSQYRSTDPDPTPPYTCPCDVQSSVSRYLTIAGSV